MVCVSGKESKCVCWLSQSICCVMINEMLDGFLVRPCMPMFGFYSR